ncbi:TSC22 domain family protein 1 isoform X3 [Aquila chrysaetos chrysaetos]|uniref:TSC22 domain family protein 1 isoform X3 n=1 Tax=Aquila chrysaetos chrysaetos TaxID=223781 RepID=UPI001B7D314A|nr:TSC22 domain family protein 1 isoform X3 [Aquila chrysaetos chrysaetos]
MRQPAPRTGCSRCAGRGRGQGGGGGARAEGGRGQAPGPHVCGGAAGSGVGTGSRSPSSAPVGAAEPRHVLTGLCPAPLPPPKGRRSGPAGVSKGLEALAGMLSCARAELGSHRLSAKDLVKSHLMYAVREEVEVLKEQIKELIEKNSQLEQENTLLKTLASPEQLAQFQAQLQTGSPPSSSQSQGTTQQPAQPASQGSGPSA